METLYPVGVVTDSATGIAPELLNTYRIGVVPFPVRIGTQTFLDGIDMTPELMFRLLRAQRQPDVSTSMPSIDAFLQLYQRMAEWAKGIISIHIAGKQSGTCNAARLAAEASPVPVMVVDTQTTAMAEGFVVLEAARAAQKGGTLAEVLQQALAVVPKVEVVALLETVNYAIQGGRLKQAARLLGNLLSIHPLVRVAENSVSLVGQVRRYGKGVQQLVDRVIEQAGAMPTHLAVHYSEDHSLGQTILDELKQRINCVEAYLSQIPVPLGAHAGPGSVGIATYIEKEQKPGLSPLQRLLNR